MLELSQFHVASERLGLSADGHRFFGTLKLRTELVPGVNIAVGVRNSTDMTFPLGFCAGESVFVCDNLSFSSELIVNRKHTKNGGARFHAATSLAVQNLVQFQAAEIKRIEYLQTTSLARYEAEALMLHAFEQGILSTRLLPLAIAQFRNPQFDWGPRDRLWYLFNAMTTPMQSRATSNPQQFALTTMKLVALMSPKEVGFDDEVNFQGVDLDIEVEPI